MSKYHLFFSIFALLSAAPITLLGQTNTIGERLDQVQFTAIEKVIDNYKEQYDIPAISVGIVHAKQRTFINRGVYHRDYEKTINETANFQIASIAKSMIGIVFKELIHAQKIDLNASITRYLPSDYAQKTIKKLTPITVRDLLHHRSGLPRESKIMKSKRKGNNPFLYHYTEADFRSDLAQVKLKYKPGEKYQYSNFAYALLGYIAERATDVAYSDLLKKYVSDKYQLSSTFIGKPNPTKVVTPYRKEDRQVPTQIWTMGKLAPPTAVFSNIEDLTQLMQQQIKVYQNNQREHALFLTADMRPKKGAQYGFGMNDIGQGYFAHTGDMDGYAGIYFFKPQEDYGFVVLTSSGGDWIDTILMDINRVITSLEVK